MSSPSPSPQAAPSRELALIKRLFSMLDEDTANEVLTTLNALRVEVEREAAEVATERAHRNAVYGWMQTAPRNTHCWPAVENLAFLEMHERIVPRLSREPQ